MARIAVTDGMAATAITRLEQSGHQVVAAHYSAQSLAEGVLADFDAVIVRSATKMTGEAIAASTSLKLIGRAGVGIDNIDLEAASAAGIVVCNTPGASTGSAIELTIGHLLASARNICRGDRDLRAGNWSKKELTGTELAGKRLGMIGFGRIAQGVGKVAQAFGMELHAFDPYLPPEIAERAGCTLHADVDEIFQICTHIAVHCNLSDETHHLVNESRLNLMTGVGADGVACGNYLVSCARGGIVCEDSVLAALQSGQLSSAALDVFEDEPIRDSPLFSEENFHGTPHIGAATLEAQTRVGLLIADSVIAFLEGGSPASVVNPN